MSASPAPALDAILLQLVSALDRYERDVARMVDTWLDMDLYREVSQEIEDIRQFSGALPRLGTQWVELLIAHAQLVHCLWRLRFSDAGGSLLEARAQHADSVAALRARCLRELGRKA